MAFASQPIAFTPTRADHDFCSAYPSFSPSTLFAGSPMSLKTGSFQKRFYPGGSPGHSLGPIAMPDCKRALPDAWEADAGAWLHAVKGGDAAQDDDLCRNYTCCGIALPDLHALVEHFEACHVEILLAPFDADAERAGGTPAFDADDMEISEPSPSPPATPAPSPPLHASAFDPIRIISLNADADSARMSAFFRAPQQQYHSSYSSLAGATGQHPPSAFNAYAGYSDYSSSLPGTEPAPAYPAAQKENAAAAAPAAGAAGQCLPPALLFSLSATPSPLNTPGSSRTGSPTPAPAPAPFYGAGAAPPPRAKPPPAGTLPLHPTSAAHAHAHAPAHRAARAPGSTLTLTKPFRCPKPGCNKSYKQQNGLKYHLSHGQCNFAPRDPEVEKLSEAERDRRLRPFVCKVGAECNRRYKNMNGLRYHYTHTGEHGAIGLEMLAQGRHPLPDVPAAGARSPKAQQHAQAQAHAQAFPPTSYYPNQQQLAPPVVSTLPVPVSAPAPPPAPAPAAPGVFPAHAHGLAWEDGKVC